jgi:hypothetical protein
VKARFTQGESGMWACLEMFTLVTKALGCMDTLCRTLDLIILLETLNAGAQIYEVTSKPNTNTGWGCEVWGMYIPALALERYNETMISIIAPDVVGIAGALAIIDNLNLQPAQLELHVHYCLIFSQTLSSGYLLLQIIAHLPAHYPKSTWQILQGAHLRVSSCSGTD